MQLNVPLQTRQEPQSAVSNHSKESSFEKIFVKGSSAQTSFALSLKIVPIINKKWLIENLLKICTTLDQSKGPVSKDA